jgi:bifunctional pyridoxal-dependent enzyme with beta-cystathionase and maltose regulon repressor activities
VNTLTDQEMQAVRLATFDLGPGYPRLTLPDYVRSVYLDGAINEIGLAMPPGWTTSKQAMIDMDLEEACRRMLMLPADSYESLSVTFSGSVALDRALVAALQMSSNRKRWPGVGVVTTTPSIDIMRLFLAEKSQVFTRFAPSRSGGLGVLDRDAVLRRVAEVREMAHAGLVVLLTSPENPTGSVWQPDDLKMIGDACFEAGGTLVVDHTFLTAGVHSRADIECVWQVFGAGQDWIAIWDTGKTFGLNEDKLGFVVSGSVRAATAVRRSLSVLQFDVSRRQKVLFTELLRRSALMDYAGYLNGICNQNLTRATKLIASTGIRLRRPAAASLLLVELPPGADDDERTRLRLLRAGIGVVAGNVFFHSRWRPRNIVRVALARDADYFSQAFSLLVKHVNG